jgi:rhodanese-related sulfurtransferase
VRNRGSSAANLEYVHPQDVPTVDVTAVALDPADRAVVLLDVREPGEWQAGHIDGALHVPMNQVPQQLQFDPGPLTPDASIVVVCKVGGRSAQVTAWLRHHGYDARNLDGGMLAWAAAKRPMTATDGGPARVA